MYHRFRQNKERLTGWPPESGDENVCNHHAGCMFPHKLKCELRKRHFWFFSRPENFLRRVPIRRRYVFFNQMSIRQGDFDDFLHTAQNRTGQWASRKVQIKFCRNIKTPIFPCWVDFWKKNTCLLRSATRRRKFSGRAKNQKWRLRNSHFNLCWFV